MENMKLCYVFVTDEIFIEEEDAWTDESYETYVVATEDVEKAKEIVLKELCEIDYSYKRRTISAELREIKEGEIISVRETYCNY